MKIKYFTGVIIAFAALVSSASADEALIKSGKKHFERKGCVTCHNNDGMGKAEDGKLALQKGPRIAGLDAEYIKTQVNDILAKKRETEFTADMIKKVGKLTPEQLDALAAYISQMGEPFKGMLQKE